jgi:hypothetical protein
LHRQKKHGEAACIVTLDEYRKACQSNNTRITIAQFKSFVHEIIREAKDILHEHLFFGVRRMNLDLVNMVDRMAKMEHGFLLMDIAGNRLGVGLKYMSAALQSASQEKTLLDERGGWMRERVLQYLDEKKRYSTQLTSAKKKRDISRD